MNVILFEATGLAATLPPPPIPGGEAAGDVWWRIIGLLLVSLVTVAIFLYLFRPPAPTPADGAEERQREEDELNRLAAQLAAKGDGELAGVIPFRSCTLAAEDGGNEVGNATARLRRILGQSARREPIDRPVRRRLGDRRGEAPPEVDRSGTGDFAVTAPMDSAGIAETRVPENEASVATMAPEEIWGDSDDLTRLLPSEADRDSARTGGVGEAIEGDLPGDLVNRRPSDADGDNVVGPDGPQATLPPSTAGEIPTERDLDRLGAAPRESGKIVPFKPRNSRKRGTSDPATIPELDEGSGLLEDPGPTVPPAPVRPITVDVRTREAIEAVVRQLLFYANVGEVLQGFGLYTDEHLSRFMAESGMPEREFQALFAAIAPKQPDDWTRIEFISRIVRLDGGQISADVRYVDGHQPNGTERLTFVQDPRTGRWLIDDIQAI